MSRVVWKHQVVEGDGTTVEGHSLRPLFVAQDPQNPGYSDLPLPTVWVERDLDPDEDAPVEQIRFIFVGTGHPIPPACDYVGSVITHLGLIWHVYMEKL
jgi:hypothetical protein